jgi:hypothetical protein
MAAQLRTPLVALVLVAGAVLIAAIAYRAGADRAGGGNASSGDGGGAAVGSTSGAQVAEGAPGYRARVPVAPPSPESPGAATGSGSPAQVLPLPSKLGGGVTVSPDTREVAGRLGLVPEELADVANARGGTLPAPTVKKLDDAYARGVGLAQRLGVDPTRDELVGNRYANQLVRIDREMRRSPPGTKLADVVEMVTNDTLSDLRKNVGDDAANAAKPDLASLQPL